MPIVEIRASEYMFPGKTDSFSFDYSHLPPMNDRNVVEKYNVYLRWYQTKDFGRPTSPGSLTIGMYDFIDSDWKMFESSWIYLIGGIGWKQIPLTSNVKPSGNKIGVEVRYSDFVQDLGVDKTPYVRIDYTLMPVKTTLNKLDDTKENKLVIIEWECDTTQKQYEVKYTNDGITKTLTGTTAQSVTLDKYTLVPGVLEYEVRTSNGYNWSDWAKGSINILEHPINLTLEPNKIAQNKDKPIVVMWSTSDIQEQFELKYEGNVNGEISGTTAISHTFSAGMFGNGMIKLTLRIYNGYVWTEKTAEFMAYGAPPNPVLTTSTSYNTATPTFTWMATEQVSYRMQVLKDDIVLLDSADIYSNSRSHKFTNVLENNTEYTVRLRTRNQYEIESEWVSKSFTVAFTELQKPYFDMFTNDKLGAIMINIYNAEGQSDFKNGAILRREYNKSEWFVIATDLPLRASYTDYTCKSGVLYEYKVRAMSKSGGYTDSDIEIKSTSLRNTMLSDITNFDNYVVLVHNPKKTRTFSKESHAMQYSGLSSPKVEYGDINYVSMNISFKVDEATLNKLFDLYYSNNILLLRDNRGKKIYGEIGEQISVEDVEFMKYNVSFTFTETSYNEGVLA